MKVNRGTHNRSGKPEESAGKEREIDGHESHEIHYQQASASILQGFELLMLLSARLFST